MDWGLPAKWTNIGWLTLAFLVALAVTVSLGARADGQAEKGAKARTVVLRAVEGSGNVPMVNGFALSSRIIQSYRTGTHCLYLDGPLIITIDGSELSFYRLECQYKRGYVDARWVNAD